MFVDFKAKHSHLMSFHFATSSESKQPNMHDSKVAHKSIFLKSPSIMSPQIIEKWMNLFCCCCSRSLFNYLCFLHTHHCLIITDNVYVHGFQNVQLQTVNNQPNYLCVHNSQNLHQERERERDTEHQWKHIPLYLIRHCTNIKRDYLLLFLWKSLNFKGHGFQSANVDCFNWIQKRKKTAHCAMLQRRDARPMCIQWKSMPQIQPTAGTGFSLTVLTL